jgi:NADH:ubiquinone oxidoreductase subunit K
MAMVGLVLFAIAVTGILTYRNLLDVAVPRSLQRLGGHVELVAAELQAVVSAARADVLAFAVEQMVMEARARLPMPRTFSPRPSGAS